MFDLSKPVPFEVVVGGIGVILILVAIGLGVVAYYKGKLNK